MSDYTEWKINIYTDLERENRTNLIMTVDMLQFLVNLTQDDVLIGSMSQGTRTAKKTAIKVVQRVIDDYIKSDSLDFEYINDQLGSKRKTVEHIIFKTINQAFNQINSMNRQLEKTIREKDNQIEVLKKLNRERKG